MITIAEKLARGELDELSFHFKSFVSTEQEDREVYYENLSHSRDPR